MPRRLAGKRREVICDDRTWSSLWRWGAAHGVPGYHNRPQFAPIAQAMLEQLTDYDALLASLPDGGLSTVRSRRNGRRIAR